MSKGTTANTIKAKDTFIDIGMLTAMDTAMGTVMDTGTGIEMGSAMAQAMGTYQATPHEVTRHYICLRQRNKIRLILERKSDRQ